MLYKNPSYFEGFFIEATIPIIQNTHILFRINRGINTFFVIFGCEKCL